MKKTIIAIAASAVAMVSLGSAADAAPFQSINQRQEMLYSRIEQGVRSGNLSRGEAMRLKGRFVSLQRLERDYRRGGLTFAERRDLDRRMDALSQSIRVQKHDRDIRGRR